MDQDWRLNGQEEYLQNETLYKVVFPDFWKKAYAEKNAFYQSILNYAQSAAARNPESRKYLNGEDIQVFWHEHCEFCWEKAMTDTEGVFYCTKDRYYWVCKKCFEDFKEKFGWTERSGDELFSE